MKIRLPINHRQYKMASSTAQNKSEFQGVSEMELEKKTKELQEEFVHLPRVFIKSVLSVNNGDLLEARKWLGYPNLLTTKPSEVSRESSSDSATKESGNNAGNSSSVTDNGKGKYPKRALWVSNFYLEL